VEPLAIGDKFSFKKDLYLITANNLQRLGYVQPALVKYGLVLTIVIVYLERLYTLASEVCEKTVFERVLRAGLFEQK
jgi:hypothetical protein